MKNRKLMLAGAVFLLLSPMARADLAQAGHEIKESAVHAARTTGEVARQVGHATAEAAKAVGHDVADAARKGYEATRRVVEKATS